MISKQWKRKRKQVDFKVVEAEAEAEAASFKKLEAEAEAEALHAEAEAEAEAVRNSPLPHHWFQSDFQSDGAIHFLEVRYIPSKPPDSVSLMMPNIKRKIFFKYLIFYEG